MLWMIELPEIAFSGITYNQLKKGSYTKHLDSNGEISEMSPK